MLSVFMLIGIRELPVGMIEAFCLPGSQLLQIPSICEYFSLPSLSSSFALTCFKNYFDLRVTKQYPVSYITKVMYILGPGTRHCGSLWCTCTQCISITQRGYVCMHACIQLGKLALPQDHNSILQFPTIINYLFIWKSL